MGTDLTVIQAEIDEALEQEQGLHTEPLGVPRIILTDERKTPRWLIEELKREFTFGLDAAAQANNAIVGNYLGPDHTLVDRRDGLAASWRDLTPLAPGWAVWCNPPYSRGSIVRWCAKATEEAKQGVRTVMLLPADTSTRYFHDYVLPNRHRFLRTRLKFEGAPLDKNGKLPPAKFGSVLVFFEPVSGLWSRG